MSGAVHAVDMSDLSKEHLLADGASVIFRPARLSDEPAIRHFLYTLSQQTLYYRFLRATEGVPRDEIRRLVYVDQYSEVSLVAVARQGQGEETVALGGYYLAPGTSQAEVAFVVKEEWQNRGMGSCMLRHLIEVAKRRGIAAFTAEVLLDNRPMQAVFRHSGCNLRSRLSRGVYSYELGFA